MKLTLQNKIRVNALIIVGLLSFYTLIYSPIQQKESMLQNYENEILATTKAVSLGVTIGLKSGDLSATQLAFDFAKAEPHLCFVALLSDGAVFASYPENLKISEALLTSDSLIVKRSEIVTPDFKGETVIGVSKVPINEANNKILLTAIFITLIAILAGAVSAYWLERSIKKPLEHLINETKKVGAGDLTVKLQYDTRDEIGQLYDATNEMIEELKETITNVLSSTASVADASRTISSSTEEMAAGAQQQTGQTGEVAGAVEEMTKTIIENSTNATSAAATAKQAKDSAVNGGKIVEETIEGMKQIAEVVRKSSVTVQELGKSSDQIGEIISVIDDIADQTNLLALNAAIEAARAGEQGRGFAVVADEVRKLAERTTKATKEIADMIKKIQLDTHGAVSSMNEGTRKVDSGILMADKAGAALTEIVTISQQLTDMVTQIASASKEQSIASEEISKNVVAISTVTSETATGTQQIARAAEDLNGLTENLQGLISKFILSNDNTPGKKASTPVKNKHRSKYAVQSNGHLVEH